MENINKYSSIILKIIELIQKNNLKNNKEIIFNAIKENDENIGILIRLGISCAEEDKLEDAILILQSLSFFVKNNSKIFYNLGVLYSLKGDQKKELDAYDTCLKINPNDVDALINKGMVSIERGNHSQALEIFNNANSINPASAEVWFAKALALINLKKYDDSLKSLDKCLSLRPNFAEAISNKGIALHGLQRYEEAIRYFDKALVINPNIVEAWSNKGVALQELQRYEEAISYFNKALSINPNFIDAWANKGISLQEIKRYEEAKGIYDVVMSLDRNYEWILGSRFFTKMMLCEWSEFNKDKENLIKSLKLHKRISRPFSILGLIDNPSLHRKCAEIYAQDKYPANNSLGPIPKTPKKEKIRIGYFSADFRNHAVSFLTAELFELHDRTRFEITAFSCGPDDQSQIRHRLCKAFDQFIDVQNKSDYEIACLAREMRIDIAIDLGGFTDLARFGIFSYRAAPIQLSYIGYLGSTAVNYIDYLIADKTIIPQSYQKFYSEKIVYLSSYQVNDRKRRISDRKFTRQELGLPESGFIFCCFNNSYKVLPSTFDGWMRILKAVEGSHLWILKDDLRAAENLIKVAIKNGIDKNRLIFAERTTSINHLARYKHADLFVDTFPYNAHTTASDALWAGLPILTLMGESFASRVAASILNAIDLPELITTSQTEYEALAIELATNPLKLTAIKEKLAKNRLTTPLFDTPLFTKNIEVAYNKMYEIYQANLEPENIYVM